MEEPPPLQAKRCILAKKWPSPAQRKLFARDMGVLKPCTHAPGVLTTLCCTTPPPPPPRPCLVLLWKPPGGLLCDARGGRRLCLITLLHNPPPLSPRLALVWKPLRWSTLRCTGSVTLGLSVPSAASPCPPSCRWAARASPTRSSPRWRFPIRKSRGRSRRP